MSNWKVYGRPRDRNIKTRREWVETWVKTHEGSGNIPRNRAVAEEIRALWEIKDVLESGSRTFRPDPVNRPLGHVPILNALDAYEADNER